MTYDTLGDFEYLGMINDVPMTLDRQAEPAGQQLRRAGRSGSRRTRARSTSPTPASAPASHLCGLLFQSTLKIDMQTVPYKGTAPAMNDLLGGQVDLMCDQTTNTTGADRGRQAIKAYAVTSSKRLTTPALKDLPTLDEAGLKGFNVTIWHGALCAQGHAEGGARQGQRGAASVALKDPDFIKREEALGAVIITDAPRQRRRAQEVRRGRDQQVGPGHQGRRPVRRLTDC